MDGLTVDPQLPSPTLLSHWSMIADIAYSVYELAYSTALVDSIPEWPNKTCIFMGIQSNKKLWGLTD